MIGRADKAPDEPATRELYRDRGDLDFAAWWRIRNPIRVKFESLHQVPGHRWRSGLGAAGVFGGSMVSFTYWDFGGASFEDLASSVAGASQNAPRPAMAVDSVAPDETLSAAGTGCEQWSRPEFPVHGVDFSGGEEDRRYGNRKIWVATWCPVRMSRFGAAGLTALRIRYAGVIFRD